MKQTPAEPNRPTLMTAHAKDRPTQVAVAPNSPELGVLEGKVRLVPYTPAWKQHFTIEYNRLIGAIGDYVKEIRHIGSTAVPGIYAKPIIDIMVGFHHIEDLEKCTNALVALGYTYEGEQDIPGWHFFKKNVGDLTTHHLHAVEWGSQYWYDRILFQEYLCRHQEIAEAYERLKLELRNKHADDRKSYTRDKTDFILKVTEMARRVQQYR
jgi:GrpB-like predicted nucleotidyltransferase (UPF0157 family)